MLAHSWLHYWWAWSWVLLHRTKLLWSPTKQHGKATMRRMEALTDGSHQTPILQPGLLASREGEPSLQGVPPAPDELPGLMPHGTETTYPLSRPFPNCRIISKKIIGCFKSLCLGSFVIQKWIMEMGCWRSWPLIWILLLVRTYWGGTTTTEVIFGRRDLKENKTWLLVKHGS